MSDKILALKYRPKFFKNIIGQDFCIQAITNSISLNKLHNAYLLSGTRGVGKTTIARVFAKSLLCQTGITNTPCGKCSSCIDIDNNSSLDLIEIDAASRTKVEDTRTLMENVQYAPTSSRFKIYLIDEVHMLSTKSFNALLKTIEEPPSHVKFLLATTEPEKLPETVVSRCLHFKLKPISNTDLISHIESVLKDENIEYDKNVPFIIAQAAKGSARDSMSLLEQCISFANGKLSNDNVSDMLGLVDNEVVDKIIEYLLTNDISNLFQFINNSNVTDYYQLLDMLIDRTFHISLSRSGCDNNLILPDEISIKSVSQEDLQVWYSILINAKENIHKAPSQIGHIMMTLLRINIFTEYISDQKSTSKEIDSSERNSNTKKKINNNGSDYNEDKFIPLETWQNHINSMNLNGLIMDLALNSILVLNKEPKLYVDFSKSNTYPKKCIEQFLELIKTHGLSSDIKAIEYMKNIPTINNQNLENIVKSKNDMYESVKDNQILKDIESVFDAKIDKDSIDKIK